MSGENDNVNMIRLSVPGTLTYRDLVLRAVASMCRLVRSGVEKEQETDHPEPVANFDDKIVSAVGEAFNNIALHGYSVSRPGHVELEVEFDHDALTIRMLDTGKAFDPMSEPAPDLESLPESHMGLYIVRAFMDEVTYSRGVFPAPNVLTLTKRYFRRANEAGSKGASE